MTRHVSQILLTLSLIWVVNLPVAAQSHLVNTREINTRDGLSHKTVRCITQDTCGFIWMATPYGLDRYDGYEFKWFTQDQYPFSGNEMSEILQGENGLFWVISSKSAPPYTDYFFVDLFNPYTFEVSPWKDQLEGAAPFVLADVQKVKSLPDGRLIFNLRNGTSYSYSLSARFQILPFPQGFALQECFGEADIWGTAGRNLLQIDWNGKIRNSYSLQERAIVIQVARDHADRHWVLLANARPDGQRGHGPAYIQVCAEGKMISVDLGRTPFFTDVCILPLPEKEVVLILHQREIFEFGANLKLRYHHPILPSDYGFGNRSSAYIDHNGLIWHGHREGLTLINWGLSSFTQYLKNGFGFDMYMTRGIATSGTKMLVASRRQGAVVNLQTGEATAFGNWTSKGNFEGWPLMVNSKGEIWGWAPDQICRLDSLGNRVESIQLPEKKGGGMNRVWGLMQDRDQTWWIGPMEGIVSYNKRTDERPQVFWKYNGFQRLQKSLKWHFLDTDGGIWVCSDNGLFLLDRKKGIIARFASDETGNRHLPAERFVFAYKDPDGFLWLATDGSGLLRIAERELFNTPQDTALQIQQFTRLSGLPSNELYAIFEDKHQHLWISTANGLARFDKKTFEINSYFEEQGITHNEFNRISYFKDASGRIYFGGLNGVTAFHPDDFYRLPPYDPGLSVSSVELFSGKTDSLIDITTAVRSGAPIVFSPGDKYFTLKLSLQDYFYSNQLHYQYRIKGLNEDWTGVVGNQMQLSNLPYGKYQLQVRAQGPDKRFAIRELTITLSFPKPFYLQNWFLFSLLLVIGLSVWQISYWRVHYLRKRQMQLEAIVRERTAKIQADKKLIEEQADQLKELNRMKSRFFANISHELRTPLTLILGPLERVLKRSRSGNRDLTYLKLMQQNGELLLKRINELLKLSRLEANELTVEPVPVALYDFLKRILAGFEGGAQLKAISLHFDFQPDQSLNVLLDPDKVETIIANYLSNAIKFTPEGGGIALAVTRQADRFQLAVRDTGIGISPEDLERVFDRFFQSADNHQQGAGIGLALCRELAQLMHGRVWGESTRGQGSAFFLELPLVETTAKVKSLLPVHVESGKQKTPVASAPETTRGSGKYSILVVEDNADLRAYIGLLLSDYHVRFAEHGARALETLKAGAPVDLIISDIMMPVMDGLELLETVKGDDALCPIPMIMLTAKQGAEARIKALRIGVDDYMVKPFREDELLARVANLLRNRSNRPAAGFVQKQVSDDKAVLAEISAADLRWLETVEQHILKNLGDRSFNLSKLAADMLMSTRRLQQKIKTVTGLTPKQYQRAIQLEQARRLLESGTFQTVAEVSYNVGFEDPHYFSTLFVQRYGKKPSAY